MSCDNLLMVLKEIRDTLLEMNKKLDKLCVITHKNMHKSVSEIDPLVLLDLPDNLRTSYMALLQLKEATAEDVAAITKRGRAVEGHYLNTIVNMGYLKKKRVGRKVYFHLR